MQHARPTSRPLQPIRAFEARYGLAVLEQDAGRAVAAYESALAAIESAPSDVARSAARALALAVSRFARAEVNGSDHDF